MASESTHRLYSAKVSKFNIETVQDQKSFFHELEALSKTNHPSILSFLGFNLKNFENDNFPTNITEYMSNGSLDHALKKQSFLTINNKYIILYGIAEGMKYLHSQGIIHRDLKPGNILLNDNLYPYICDFGLSKLSDLSISSITFDSFVGTPVYMAPEIFIEKRLTNKVDVNGMDGYANMCKNGDGIPVSKQEAAFYYQKAIDKGNVDSMFNYALMLSEGDTLLIKDQTAINLFKTAAEKGHPKSMYVYGRQLCIKSICDNISEDQYDENFELGLKYMKNAASKGDEIAIEKYAEFAFDYLNREEIEELFSFVKKASDEGNEKLKQLYSLLESKRPIGNGEKWKRRICS